MVMAVMRITGQAAVGVAFALPVAMMVIIVVMPVIMMVVRMAVTRIGAAHRRKGLDDISHRRAEAFEHRLDDMVAQDEDTIGLDGGGEMPVADVPGKLGEMDRIACADVVKLFGRRADLDQAPVLQHQPVAVGERHGLGKIDQHFAAIGEFDGPAAQMPLVMRQARPCRRRCRTALPAGATDTARGNLVKSVLRESFIEMPF